MNKEIKTPEDLEDYCKKTTGYGMNVPPFVYIDKYFEDIEKAYGNGYRAGYKERFDCNIGEAEKEADNVRNSLIAIKATQKQSCEEEDVAKAFQLGLAFGLCERHDEMDKVIGEVKKSVTPQSCDDCISRQEVDELSKALVHTTRDKADFLCNFWEGLQKLPSVTPQPCDDAVSREAVMHILDEVGGDFDSPREAVVPIDYIADMVSELPSVSPQPKMGNCKNCKYFEYCKRWGEGCKTKEDGYCFLFEPKTQEEKE